MNDDFAEAPRFPLPPFAKGGPGEICVRRWALFLSVGTAGRSLRERAIVRSFARSGSWFPPDRSVGGPPGLLNFRASEREVALQAREPSPCGRAFGARIRRRGRRGSQLAAPIRMLEGVR